VQYSCVHSVQSMKLCAVKSAVKLQHHTHAQNAALSDQRENMATVIIDLKIMPSSPDVNLEKLTKEIDTIIAKYGGKLHKHEIQPVAFGLKALLLIMTMDESKGSTDALEEQIAKVKGVESVQVTGVSRALG